MTTARMVDDAVLLTSRRRSRRGADLCKFGLSCAKEARRVLLAQTQAGTADVVQVAAAVHPPALGYERAWSGPGCVRVCVCERGCKRYIEGV